MVILTGYTGYILDYNHYDGFFWDSVPNDAYFTKDSRLSGGHHGSWEWDPKWTSQSYQASRPTGVRGDEGWPGDVEPGTNWSDVGPVAGNYGHARLSPLITIG